MRLQPIVHPFLLALFPVLFLFSHNMEQLSPRVMVAPATVLLAGALILWSLLTLLLKDAKRAGLLVSIGLLLFFSYGHVSGLVVSSASGEPGGLRHRHLLALWTGLFALGAYFSLRARANVSGLNKFLNLAAAFAVAFPLASMAVYEARSAAARQPGGAHGGDVTPLRPTGELPHLYYIILDEYAGDDILRDMYGYDNRPFLDSLSHRGFYVARGARSNYHFTHLSLASSLNLSYLAGTDSWKRDIKNNRVFRALRKCGYTIVGFSSETSYTDLRNVDLYMRPDWSFSEFQNQLINATPLFLVTSRLFEPVALHRRHISYTLEHLPDPAGSRDPAFVFAHILCPHPPFVFNEDGSPAGGGDPLRFDDTSHTRDTTLVDEYVGGYRKQVAFLNQRLTAVVDSILSASSRPCVIILQADHGPRAAFYPDDIQKSYLRERFSILNAYYFPRGDYSELYQSISPVNTFRVIFNRYFGAEYELLDDRCFLTPPEAPNTLLEVTAAVVDRSAADSSAAAPPR
ncbi:MAG: hypothetical protein JW952_00635 [Candidatus Eisenbacteria bacterium]|nr:hypothetical protein [Candidatus Eisenbacteria bacterium]